MKSIDLRIALYARVSTEAQEEEGQSLSTQIGMMRDAAHRIGAQVVEEYQIQESAMPGGERPSLTRMLKDAASGRFDAVMVCKVDRLSRAIDVLRHIENSLNQFGVALFEGVEEQNLRSAEGRLNRGMQALIGEYSVNRLKWSAAASRLERARRGWPHSGMLPFARRIVDAKDRRNTDAEWALDDSKVKVAAEMYKLYLIEGLNLAQVGKRVNMQPETVRRIMMNQGGTVWERTFIDPATGERVDVSTSIPALYTPEQIARLHAKAKQNQIERNGWITRSRDYPLSQYLRCANPNCGWSNMSGHQTYDKRNQIKDPTAKPISYAYYLHLARKRHDSNGHIDHNCVNSVPAGDMEDEVFSRLGQFLIDSTALASAVRSALITDPEKIEGLQAEKTSLLNEQKKARRVMRNAMDLLFEQKGNEAAKFAQAKVDELNVSITSIDGRLKEIEDALKIVKMPADFPARFAASMQRLVGLHGHMPMHWPVKAKKALLALFFGGKSTRFDRAATHERSDSRGIFVRRVTDADGEAYFHYEAKGRIGDFSGALTRVVETYEAESTATLREQFSREDLLEMASLANHLEGFLDFRSPRDVCKRWSAPGCRETVLQGPAACAECPERARQSTRASCYPAAVAGNL